MTATSDVPTKEQVADAKGILLRAHRAYLKYLSDGGDAKGSVLDFSGENLSRANFSGANFFGARLNESNFEKADLSGSNFHSADLRGANLAVVKLGQARLPARFR